MDRRTFSLSALAFAVAPALRAQWPQRDADVASIDTFILSLHCKDQALLAVEQVPFKPTAPILMQTMPPPIKAAEYVQDGSSILTPPAGRMQDAQALIHEYKESITGPNYPIPAHLKLPRPYRLITAVEREQFFVLQTDTPARNALPAGFKRDFKHVTSIFTLSRAAFHSTLPLALVFCSERTVGSSTTWLYILERSGSSWSQLPWPTATLSYEEVS